MNLVLRSFGDGYAAVRIGYGAGLRFTSIKP